jgi:hypothetical protein
MIIIKYNNPNNSIKVTIEINDIELWHYRYVADATFINSNKLQRPCEHELDIAKNLDSDVHYWEIQLGNITDEDIKAKVIMKWFENGNEIARWIPIDADQDGRIIVNANSGLERTDSAYFIKS